MDKEDITIPEPIEHEDGSLEWTQSPDYIPREIPEQDLEPVEVDEDYSPPEEGDDVEGEEDG